MNKDIRVAALRENGLGSEVINTFNNLLVQLANANLRYKELYYSIRDDQKANESDYKQSLYGLNPGQEVKIFIEEGTLNKL